MPGEVAQKLVYLDNNASTRIDERVLVAMLEVYRAGAANAASAHAAGRSAAAKVDEARERVATLLGARPREIVFTSGATEADNLAIKGFLWGGAGGRRHIVTCATEHPAVLEPVRLLERSGYRVSVLPVLPSGQPDLERLEDIMDPTETALVSVMAVNNETGVQIPVAEVADIAHKAGALYHCDATQALAWGIIQVEELGIDLLSMSGHKLHGPQGTGALFVSRRVVKEFVPLFSGGGHERGLRSGTVNVAGCVGLGVAAELVTEEGPAAARRVRDLRDGLEVALGQSLDGVAFNGGATTRAPGTTNVRFAQGDSEAIMALLPDVAVSSGSACTSLEPRPSHVLTAMGLAESEAMASLRISLSRDTSAGDVAYATRRIVDAAKSVARRWGAEVPSEACAP
jgi:cysteine desulfurase